MMVKTYTFIYGTELKNIMEKDSLSRLKTGLNASMITFHVKTTIVTNNMLRIG
jgi:hypothetical protein